VQGRFCVTLTAACSTEGGTEGTPGKVKAQDGEVRRAQW